MNKYIETLIQLTKENPELDVITMVDYEVSGGDEYRYWKGEICEVRKDIYYDKRDCILIGEDEIKDTFLNDLEKDPVKGELPFKRKIEEVESLCDVIKFKEAIFIFIGV